MEKRLQNMKNTEKHRNSLEPIAQNSSFLKNIFLIIVYVQNKILPITLKFTLFTPMTNFPMQSNHYNSLHCLACIFLIM